MTKKTIRVKTLNWKDCDEEVKKLFLDNGNNYIDEECCFIDGILRKKTIGTIGKTKFRCLFFDRSGNILKNSNSINQVYQLFGFFNNSKNKELLKIKNKYQTNYLSSDRIDNLTRGVKIGANYLSFSTYHNFFNFSHIITEMVECEAVSLFDEILSWNKILSFEEQKEKLEKFIFINNKFLKKQQTKTR